MSRSIPQVNQGDLGADPLAYAQKAASRSSRELWERYRDDAAEAGRELRRCCAATSTRGLIEAGQGAVYAAKYIGGLDHVRDHAGTGRAPLTPVRRPSSARR